MKNQFMLKSIKYAFALVLVLFASSCMVETDELNTIDETIVKIKDKQMNARLVIDPSVLIFNSPSCVDEEQTLTLAGWSGTASLNVQIYDESISAWVTIDNFDGQYMSPQSFLYTFTQVGTHMLRFQVGTSASNGGTEGFIEISAIVEDCGSNEEGCSLSQGYWFAKPEVIWPFDVVIGGKSYTQAEGLAIWNSSNKGGIKDAKKGFLQVAAIKLSGTVLNTDAVWDDVKIVEDWLGTIEKVTGETTDSNKEAKKAAGRIGEWIDDNHCIDE